MKTRLWLVALLALSAATLGACGGDDSEDTPEAGSGGSGGSDSDGGAGTSGGSGGSGGTGGGGGSGGGAPMAMPIMCGSNTCNPPENPLAALGGLIPGGGAGLPTMAFACCLENDECGYAMTPDATGAACNEPAEPDERCPDFMLMFGGGGAADAGAGLPPIMSGFGCCVDNMCGVDGSLFGGGCNENGAARTMLMSIPLLGMFLVDGIPEPRACDAPPMDAGGDGDDAGSE